MQARNALLRGFWEMPPITRAFISASVATTFAVQLEILSPFQLYFNPKLIFGSHQYWRIITTFLYFGPLGFNFLFNIIFIYRYCKMLEEQFFSNRTADFFYMFIVGGALMCMLAYFVNLLFLGHAFTIMLVYIWSRRNPGLRMNFFGLLTFQAPYLSWVLLAFSILLGSSTVVDIIGIIVGHFYYFFEDVFANEAHGFRLLETPRPIKYIFNRLGFDEPVLAEENRPEQFNFVNEPRPNPIPRPTPPPPTAQHQPEETSASASASTSTSSANQSGSEIRERARRTAEDNSRRYLMDTGNL